MRPPQRAGISLNRFIFFVYGLEKTIKGFKRVTGSVSYPESDRICASIILRLGCQRGLWCEAFSAAAPDALSKRLPSRFQVDQEPLDGVIGQWLERIGRHLLRARAQHRDLDAALLERRREIGMQRHDAD
jgi:hypothetical protein